MTMLKREVVELHHLFLGLCEAYDAPTPRHDEETPPRPINREDYERMILAAAHDPSEHLDLENNGFPLSGRFERLLRDHKGGKARA